MSGEEDAEFYPAMRARLVKTGSGYGAIGFSKDGLMYPADAIIGQPGATPEAYENTGYERPKKTDAFGLSDVAVTKADDGTTAWDFTRMAVRAKMMPPSA